MAKLYYLATTGSGSRGPLTEEQLIAEARAGGLSLDSDVCLVGAQEWRQAREVPFLAAILAPPPPPRAGPAASRGAAGPPRDARVEEDEPTARQRDDATLVGDDRVAQAYGTWLRYDDTFIGVFDVVPDLARCESAVRAALGARALAPRDLARAAQIDARAAFVPAYEITIHVSSSYQATVLPYREVVEDGRKRKVHLQPMRFAGPLARRSVRRWQSGSESTVPTDVLRGLLPFGPYTPARSDRVDIFTHECVPLTSDLREGTFGPELRAEERERATAHLEALLRRQGDLRFERPAMDVQTELTVSRRFVSVIPVWLGNFHYRARSYPFFVNGGTGKVCVPSAPRSLPKLLALGAVFAAAIATGYVGWRSISDGAPDTPAPAAPDAVELDVSVHAWADRIIDVSSQYGGRNAAPEAVGPPDVFPESGDRPGAWAPATRSGSSSITVGFPAMGMSCGLVIIETNGPGAVVSVEDVSRREAPVVLLDRPIPPGSARARPSLVSFPPREVTAVRLLLNAEAARAWPEIDAVGLAPCAPDGELAAAEVGAGPTGSSAVPEGPVAHASEPASWCVCFLERYGEDEREITACRPTEAACDRLERAARGEGSRTIVGGSLIRPCESVSELSWFSRPGWARSSVADGWVHEDGCDL